MNDGKPIEVETSAGRIRGVTDAGIHRFLGVPYGAPPVGDQRFRRARPVEPWDGVRPAVEHGPPSIQAPGRPGPLSLAATPMSEDCLVANVWTPGLDGRRPVMVWLHGGGFTQGDASGPLYDGTNLARRGDVVVVGLNHRLGLLGFLHLEGRLGPGYEGSDNAGLLDVVLALRWIAANAERFGGDPGCVTLFGESGGGGKVSALLAMPEAAGLFHRAIIESGPPFQFGDPTSAEAVLDEVLAELGLGPGEARRLLDLPPDRLFAVQVALGAGGGPGPGGMSFAPVSGTVALPLRPEEAVARGASADVPLIIGTNEHEARFMTFMAPELAGGGPPIDDAELIERLAGGCDHGVEGLVAHYRRAFPELSNVDLLLLVESEQFRIRSLRLAEPKVTGGRAPVYSYLFRRTSAAVADAGSFHGMEMPFVFDNLHAMPYLLGDEGSTELAAQMSTRWAAFARTGRPDVEGLEPWPTYSLDRRATMLIDRGWTVEDDPLGEHRRAWVDVPTGPRTRPWARILS